MQDRQIKLWRNFSHQRIHSEIEAFSLLCPDSLEKYEKAEKRGDSGPWQSLSFAMNS
jgi:hypothetical protein